MTPKRRVTWQATSERRKFLATLGGAAAAWSLAAGAQQATKVPTIGILGSGIPTTQDQWYAAFVQRLRNSVRGAQRARGGALCRHRPARGYPPHSHQYLGAGHAAADDAHLARRGRSGRSDVLWSKLAGLVPASCRLCRQDSAWGNKIKHCRRVATRYDKLAANYLAFVQLASIGLWLRVNESTS